MSLLVFILILSVLVLIHEFGHFIVAKKNGIHVEEFGLGIPPRLFGKKIGDTFYSFNLLPFGGFVKLYGEDEEMGTPEDFEKLTHDPKSFMSKSALARTAVLMAGVFMNFVLAVSLYLVFFMFTGFKTLNLPVFFDYKFKFGTPTYTSTVITGFADNSAALAAGVHPGEAVIAVNGQAVSSIEDLHAVLKDKVGKEVTVSLNDLSDALNNPMREVTVIPTANDAGNGILGVYLTITTQIEYKNKVLAPFEHAYNMVAYTGATLGKFIDLAVETKSMAPVSSTVSGPVGIYSVVDLILSQGGKVALLGLIDFTALMSLTLAIMNALPLPALDGGRFFFVLLEVITRRKVNYKFENAVHKWGMLFFFGLLILITIKDIIHIF